MGNLFGDRRDPELHAREAIRKKKWGKAVAFYEKNLEGSERDYRMWNLVGDLHMNNGSRAQAVEAWRRAMEVCALEGLHENVVGIARKILRRTPEEEDVHLVLAEAYLGLEYHADCLAALRSYLKLAKRRSEPEMRALFKRILAVPIGHYHLLEELSALYRDSAIEDIELERQVSEYIEVRRQTAQVRRFVETALETTADEAMPAAEAGGSEDPAAHGLVGLDSLGHAPGDESFDLYAAAAPPALVPTAGPLASNEFAASSRPRAELPEGEGKDHYDLGMVYKEMKLWDAAIAEFEESRRDAAFELHATLALAECLQEKHDLQGALQLLESARTRGDESSPERLDVVFRIGLLHEMLGNLDEALANLEAVSRQSPTYADVELRAAGLRSRVDRGDAIE